MRSGSSVDNNTISTGKVPPPGRAGGIAGNISNPRDCAEFCLDLRHQLEGGFLSLIPGLQHHSAEAATREGQLECEFRLRKALENLSGGVGKGRCLFDG